MRKIVTCFLLMGLFAACAGENEQNEDQTVNIQGAAQKGQLVKGSQVTAYSLNNNLLSIGQSYPAAISDDLGSFQISATTGGKYLELRAEGYYFIENTGSIADSPIYLQSIIESKDKNANINLLTTLTVPRIKYLVSNGAHFAEAKNMAQNEIIKALTKGSCSSTTMVFDEMDISKDSDANAVLLALSCLLQEGRNTGEALGLISDISSDFEKTGTVSDEFIDKLYSNSDRVDVLSIINNLKEFYKRKGVTDYSIPAFYKYIGNTLSDTFTILNEGDFNKDKESDVLYLKGLPYEGVSVKLFFLSPATVQIQHVDETGETHTYSWISSSIEPYETIAWVANFDIKANSNLRRRAYINIVDEDGTVLQSLFFDQNANAEKVTTTALETRDATEVEASSAVLNASLDLTGVQYDSVSYGFYWGTSEIDLNTKLTGGEIKDNVYSSSLTNLSHKTQYWYKPYVTLDGQTFFGEVRSFTTDVVPVQSVSLDKTEYTFNTIGKTLTLNATVLPFDATEKSVEWSSDKESVVIVNQNGIVKAVGNGTATITVTTKDQSKTATCSITVAQWVKSISLGKTFITLNVGQEQTLTATVNPDNAADKTLKWTSSDVSVATVDQNGTVSAKAKGFATIKVTADDGSRVSASSTIRVMTGPCPAEAIDLGLSVYWATCNLSRSGFVSSPGAYGDYYAWGETETKSDYSEGTYKFGSFVYGIGWRFSKYSTSSSYGTVDNKTVLELEDDVAHVILGGKWRMPTDDEWAELLNNCTRTWTDNYNGTGVKGRIVTSNIEGYKDKSIFLPAAGIRYGTTLGGAGGAAGNYWSSSLDTEYSENAWSFLFAINEEYMGTDWRYDGQSVRPVSE